MDLSKQNIDEIIVETNEDLTMFKDDDDSAASRKKDHIALAFKSQIQQLSLDTRFNYEPLLSAHPIDHTNCDVHFLDKTFRAPLWVSSMTGGTEWAKTINHNLARAAQDFGFGMGLGSCRSLLSDNTYLKDFDVRHIIGDNLPLYANLGIAQIEKLLSSNQLSLVDDLIDKLKADGLIVHVNPMQEWLQPEGDRFQFPPIDTIKRLIDLRPDLSIIVKEVGQGMGYESLKALLKLPIKAIDFAAAGGTGFSELELLRTDPAVYEAYKPLSLIGHCAAEMVDFVNQILDENKDINPKQLIISGGIQSFIDGYYLINKSNCPAVYGQASAFLKHARGSYEELYHFVDLQIKGLRVAESFFKVK